MANNNPPSYPPPPIPPPPPPGAKKTNPLIWILGILAVLVVLFSLAFVVIGVFVVHKVKQAADKVTMNSSDDKDRTKVSVEADGKKATITAGSGEDGKGVLEVQSSDGSVKIGGGGSIPSWVPSYPGAKPMVNFSARGNDAESGSYRFETSDAADKVAAYYSDKLKEKGFKITSNVSGQLSGLGGNMIAAENEDKSRTVLVTVGNASGSGNMVNVVFTSKR